MIQENSEIQSSRTTFEEEQHNNEILKNKFTHYIGTLVYRVNGKATKRVSKSYFKSILTFKPRGGNSY